MINIDIDDRHKTVYFLDSFRFLKKSTHRKKQKYNKAIQN